jgi:hypothetical protein
MSATFTWTINWMGAYPSYDGQTDVVIQAGWNCAGEERKDASTVCSSSSFGTASFTLDPSVPFTPYADLTESQVLGWVWASGVDQTEVEARVQELIDAQLAPVVVTPPLPWNPPPVQPPAA